MQDPSTAGRLVAIRIRFLPKGTIVVEQYLPEKYVGSVEKEAGVTHSTPCMTRALLCFSLIESMCMNFIESAANR